MKNVNPVVEELKVLRDELKLQGHLFSMEAKDEFEILEQKFHVFEKKMEEYMVKFGEFNEDFWVGHKDEVDHLKKEYEKLRNSNIDGR